MAADGYQAHKALTLRCHQNDLALKYLLKFSKLSFCLSLVKQFAQEAKKYPRGFHSLPRRDKREKEAAGQNL